MSNLIEAKYWKKIDSKHIRCLLCPQACKLAKNQKGLCFSRQNISGKLVTHSYGRIVGSNVDPIEKKPLYHFKPGSKIFSFGTYGCNLSCKFCQNFHLSSPSLNEMTQEISPERLVDYIKSLNIDSIAFTYNEPTVFIEYVIDVARLAKKNNMTSVSVSSGYISQGKAIDDFYENIDAANIDLKSFSNDFYKKKCGGNLETVLDTLKFLKSKPDIWLEITTLIIPRENDSEEELNKMIDWVLENLGPDVPWHFSAFYPAYKFTDHIQTDPKSLLAIRDLALKKGVNYVYTGNIASNKGSNTYCHKCNSLLVDRTFYQIKNIDIVHGKCSKCKTKIPGCFRLQL